MLTVNSYNIKLLASIKYLVLPSERAVHTSICHSHCILLTGGEDTRSFRLRWQKNRES